MFCPVRGGHVSIMVRNRIRREDRAEAETVVSSCDGQLPRSFAVFNAGHLTTHQKRPGAKVDPIVGRIVINTGPTPTGHGRVVGS